MQNAELKKKKKKAFGQQNAAVDGAVKASFPHLRSAASADSERGKQGLSPRGQPFCCSYSLESDAQVHANGTMGQRSFEDTKLSLFSPGNTAISK